MITNYVRFNKNEIKDLSYILFVLTLLFSITYIRFNLEESFLTTFIIFAIFLLFLLLSRFLFMKFIAYKNGFEFEIKMTYFDRYWIRNFDRLSYTADAMRFVDPRNFNKGVYNPQKEQYNIKGVPTPLISILLYILTLGFIILPCTWKFIYKQIPHKFLGTKLKYESSWYFPRGVEVTQHRHCKSIFYGFLYYFIIGIILKIICNIFEINFYNWFLFIIYWIAFMSIMPIIGTEGFELWIKSRPAWIMTFVILVTGMSALLVFKSMTYMIFVTIFTIIIVSIYMLWKNLFLFKQW